MTATPYTKATLFLHPAIQEISDYLLKHSDAASFGIIFGVKAFMPPGKQEDRSLIGVLGGAADALTTLEGCVLAAVSEHSVACRTDLIKAFCARLMTLVSEMSIEVSTMDTQSCPGTTLH